MSAWYERIKRFYDNGLWTMSMVADGVRAKKISPQEYYTITKDKEYLKTLVVEGVITADEYKIITDEDYVG